jgi:arabinose-5-phosphate isomerase
MTDKANPDNHLSPAEPRSPSDLVRIEAAALQQLADRLEGPQRETFARVSALIVSAVQSGHRVILTGIGKSGLIARKVAATLLSTGTPAHFLHPSEALHGDLGLLADGDVLIALSYSGETEEVARLLSVLPRLNVSLISFCGCPDSTIASASLHVLDVSVDREACAHQLAPTASTTAMLALGDALAIDVSRRLHFQPRDFADLHPGGQLGRRLSSVRKLMHTGEALPSVSPTATMPEIIHEMSAKRLGLTTVQSHGRLLGVISDGDLRRLFERLGPEAFHKTAAEVLHPNPRTISPEPLALDALTIMEQHKITALIVTEHGSPTDPVLGVVHLHDLWELTPRPEAVPPPTPPVDTLTASDQPMYPLSDTDDGRL